MRRPKTMIQKQMMRMNGLTQLHHPFCLEWGLVPWMFSHPVLWQTPRLVHLRGPRRLAPINLVLCLAHPRVPLLTVPPELLNNPEVVFKTT
jgi:hypothetical protein